MIWTLLFVAKKQFCFDFTRFIFLSILNVSKKVYMIHFLEQYSYYFKQFIILMVSDLNFLIFLLHTSTTGIQNSFKNWNSCYSTIKLYKISFLLIKCRMNFLIICLIKIKTVKFYGNKQLVFRLLKANINTTFSLSFLLILL